MPGMDGIELLKTVKEHNAHVEVIIMAALGEEYTFMDVMREGSSDFIVKPFSLGEMSAKVDRVLRERKLIEEVELLRLHTEKLKER